MIRVGAILIRGVVIIAGYVVACFAASAFLFLTFFGLLLDFYGGQSVPTEDVWRLLRGGAIMIPTAAVLIAYVAFVPSAATFAVAEFFRWRGWLIYAAAGGIAGLIAAEMFLPSGDFVALINGFDLPAGRSPIESPVYPFAMLIGGGMCGGLAYWAVAGRRAPDWPERHNKGKGVSPTSPAPSKF